MANQKLSELTAITNADLAADDKMLVTDTSATASKSLLISELDKRFNTPVDEYSSAQTLDDANKIVLCDTSGAAFTITLPAAASYSDKTFKIIKKPGLTDFNKLTISDGGSFSEFLYGAGESITVFSNGTTWYVASWGPSETMTYAPTLTNVQNIDINTSRVMFHAKKYYILSGIFTLNGAGTTAAGITVSIPFAAMDTDLLANGTSTTNEGATNLSGKTTWFNSGTAWEVVQPKYVSTTTFGFWYTTQALFGSQLASGDSIQYPGVIIPIGS